MTVSNSNKQDETVRFRITVGVFQTNLQIKSTENNRYEGLSYLRTCRTFEWNFAVN